MTGLCGRSDRGRGLRPPGSPPRPLLPPCPAPAAASGPTPRHCLGGDPSCWVVEDLRTETRGGPDSKHIEIQKTKNLL